MVVLGAAALGAGQLIDRFKTDAVSTDIRLQLWRQGLHVFAAHPFGIGRGAFDRVFPIYRSIRMPCPLTVRVRRERAPSAPHRLRVALSPPHRRRESPWSPGRFSDVGRRDKIEAALLAGVFAVLVHSFVDFGLETLGVLLPFAAVLGMILGRHRSSGEQTVRSRWSARAPFVMAGLASAGLIFGIASLAHRSYDDFDALLRRPSLADGPTPAPDPGRGDPPARLSLRARRRALGAAQGRAGHPITPPARPQPRAPPLPVLRGGARRDCPEPLAHGLAASSAARMADCRGHPAVAVQPHGRGALWRRRQAAGAGVPSPPQAAHERWSS